jgi:ubiquinone/menaquinone biosynthesis C-methylase UbiE
METQKVVPQIEVVVGLIKEIKSSDHPEEFWENAVSLARNENNVVNDEYPDVDIEEIVSFGEEILKAESDEGKQKLLMTSTKSGRLWYDVALGDGNKIVFEPVKKYLDEKSYNGELKFGKVADIGCGTGNTLRTIAPYCENIIGVDLSSLAIEKAREIGVPENVSLLFGKADKLPFSDQSLDLVVSNGLIYYLSLKETEGFVSELSRVLRSEGLFLYSNIIQREGEILPKILSNSLESAKSALLYILGKIIQDGGHPESLGMLDFHKLMLKNNFSVYNKIDDDNRILLEYTRN